MQEEIAEFFPQIRIVRPLDRINDLVTFLDECPAEAGVCLFTVPGAAVGSPEPGHNFP